MDAMNQPCRLADAGGIQQNGTANSLAGQFVIANQSSLTLTSSVVSQLQSALVEGPTGAFVNQSAPLVISNSTVHIVDSIFSSNQRFDFGGIVIMSGSAVTISNCTFESLTGRVGGAVMIMNGSLVMMDQGTAFSSNAGSCLAGAVLVNSDSALYMEGVAFSGNQALGDRGGGAVLLYGNSTLHASSSTFTDNAATAANLYAVDAAAMAAGTRPSDDAIPSLWCGAVGGVPGVDSLYGINDLASNHLLGGYSGKCVHWLHRWVTSCLPMHCSASAVWSYRSSTTVYAAISCMPSTCLQPSAASYGLADCLACSSSQAKDVAKVSRLWSAVCNSLLLARITIGLYQLQPANVNAYILLEQC